MNNLLIITIISLLLSPLLAIPIEQDASVPGNGLTIPVSLDVASSPEQPGVSDADTDTEEEMRLQVEDEDQYFQQEQEQVQDKDSLSGLGSFQNINIQPIQGGLSNLMAQQALDEATAPGVDGKTFGWTQDQLDAVKRGALDYMIKRAMGECPHAKKLAKFCKELTHKPGCPTRVDTFAKLYRAYETCPESKAVQKAWSFSRLSPFDKCHYDCENRALLPDISIKPKRFTKQAARLREKYLSCDSREGYSRHRIMKQTFEKCDLRDELRDDDVAEVKDVDTGATPWWCCFTNSCGK
eukprot:TRINITY_DN1528_c0_g1_i3.p1 TRINITY_DN1528_c0_g1~~TRINITY_DN1528_c0_g1_i3.p1  ORF type:complete len:296 (+),score=92.32 TRINITY_DN1528_c0_g1_i3:84-971(+)